MSGQLGFGFLPPAASPVTPEPPKAKTTPRTVVSVQDETAFIESAEESERPRRTRKKKAVEVETPTLQKRKPWSPTKPDDRPRQWVGGYELAASTYEPLAPSYAIFRLAFYSWEERKNPDNLATDPIAREVVRAYIDARAEQGLTWMDPHMPQVIDKNRNGPFRSHSDRYFVIRLDDPCLGVALRTWAEAAAKKFPVAVEHVKLYLDGQMDWETVLRYFPVL